MTKLRVSCSRKLAKRAKVISISDQQLFKAYVGSKRHGARNVVISLLSFKAGLRACEIAGLSWPMICDAGGQVGDSLEISSSIAKKGSGRRIPIHRDLVTALKQLHAHQGEPLRGPVCQSERGSSMTAKGVVNWFAQYYRELGFEGCSSHSGRRSMITFAARSLAQVGGSLRDVQELAGHRNLATTEGYIQGDRAIQRCLIELV
jgi:integrase/recombinase XerC